MRYIILLPALLLISCSSDDPGTTSDDSFQMELNNVAWQPYASENGCFQHWSVSQIRIVDSQGSRDYYTLIATVDPDPTTINSPADAASTGQQYLEIHFTRENDETEFLLHKKKENNDQNYTRLTRDMGNEEKVYESDSIREYFSISIDRFIPETPYPGVELRFGGVLYNIQQPADSLIITNGRVLTQRLPGMAFNHCY